MVGALLVSALWIDIKTDFISTIRYENGMEDLVYVALSNNFFVIFSLWSYSCPQFTKDHCGTVPIRWCLLCICSFLVVLLVHGRHKSANGAFPSHLRLQITDTNR